MTELGDYATLASPTLTGTPAAPTAAADTNTTQIATTAYVQTELGALSSDSISDADNNTKIQVEESSDENIIRFDTAGSERLTIAADGVAAFSGAVGIAFSGTPGATGAKLDVGGYITWNAQVSEVNPSSGTTYTTDANDKGRLLRIGDEANNTAAQSVTIPPNSSVAYDVGTQLQFIAMGGQVTIVAGSGVTIRATPGLKLRTQYSSATAIKIATDEWILIGDLDDD
jgi:hypothetical protein